MQSGTPTVPAGRDRARPDLPERGAWGFDMTTVIGGLPGLFPGIDAEGKSVESGAPPLIRADD